MIRQANTQAIISEKPFAEVWGPSIVMGSVGLIVGLTTAMLAYKAASRGLTNILNAQSDKHRKDLEREAINAKRQRDEKRLLQLIGEYAQFFALAFLTLNEERYNTIEDRKNAVVDFDTFKKQHVDRINERNFLAKRILFLDIDPQRSELITKVVPVVRRSGTEPTVADFERVSEEMYAIQVEIRNSLKKELKSLA